MSISRVIPIRAQDTFLGQLVCKTRRKYLDVDWLFILMEAGGWLGAGEHLAKFA